MAADARMIGIIAELRFTNASCAPSLRSRTRARHAKSASPAIDVDCEAVMKHTVTVGLLQSTILLAASSAAARQASTVPTPTDIKPGSITCEDVPYPYP